MVFSSNSSEIEFKNCSLTEIIELPNFGHKTTCHISHVKFYRFMRIDYDVITFFSKHNYFKVVFADIIKILIVLIKTTLKNSIKVIS